MSFWVFSLLIIIDKLSLLAHPKNSYDLRYFSIKFQTCNLGIWRRAEKNLMKHDFGSRERKTCHAWIEVWWDPSAKYFWDCLTVCRNLLWETRHDVIIKVIYITCFSFRLIVILLLCHATFKFPARIISSDIKENWRKLFDLILHGMWISS